MQKHEERPERGALIPPCSREKRPHSRITSQKRLASRNAGNRMAFVSFRIMSSPGHITRNEATSADTNVITGERMLLLLERNLL